MVGGAAFQPHPHPKPLLFSPSPLFSFFLVVDAVISFPLACIKLSLKMEAENFLASFFERTRYARCQPFLKNQKSSGPPPLTSQWRI